MENITHFKVGAVWFFIFWRKTRICPRKYYKHNNTILLMNQRSELTSRNLQTFVLKSFRKRSCPIHAQTSCRTKSWISIQIELGRQRRQNVFGTTRLAENGRRAASVKLFDWRRIRNSENRTTYSDYCARHDLSVYVQNTLYYAVIIISVNTTEDGNAANINNVRVM